MTNKTIMLVDDNPSDIDLTIRAFKKERISNDIVVAENGIEALEYLFGEGKYEGRDTSQLPTVVLLDLKMPLMGGLETLEKIRESSITRRLPVVILTSSKEEEDVARSYDLGVNSYIRKPVNFSQFMEAVKSLGMYWLVLNEIPPKCQE